MPNKFEGFYLVFRSCSIKTTLPLCHPALPALSNVEGSNVEGSNVEGSNVEGSKVEGSSVEG